MELLEVVTPEHLYNLGFSESYLTRQRKLGLEDPFAWVLGCHWFRPSDGKILFNLKMVEIWMIAKSTNNPDLHYAAVNKFWEDLEFDKRRKKRAA